MRSREEKRAINTAFWTRFKAEAGKIKGANGQKMKWVNYPTGVKQLYIRLTANDHKAGFFIEIQDKDASIRLLLWEQFIELRKVLEKEMGENGEWDKQAHNEAGFPIYRIAWSL